MGIFPRYMTGDDVKKLLRELAESIQREYADDLPIARLTANQIATALRETAKEL